MSIPRILAVLAALGVATTASAQKAPRIGYVYPAGGQQGQTFEVTLGGQFLTGATDVYFSGKGIDATVVSHERPLSGKETELLRDKLKQLEEGQKALPASQGARGDSKTGDEIANIKEKLAKFGNGPQFNVAIAENVRLRVTLAHDATLGEQEIRLATPNGLSNPLVFCVGQLPEFSEPAARGSLKAEIDGKLRGRRKRGLVKASAAKDELRVVALPAVFNGQILPGEADRLRFTARRGQRVVVATSARKLIPYLPDAVPGWFQATLAIYDAEGRELAYVDDFGFDPDPALCYTMPKDGEYEIEIRDSIYRGREDFVYRVTAGELPFVTSIFPLGGATDGLSNVELRGWNLTTPTLPLDLRHSNPGILSLVARTGQTVSNFVPFAVDALPETFEKEPNNSAAAAQAPVTPVIINGRIDQPGDVDVFRVEGKAGDEIVAEIHARRLNSRLDSVIRITDAAGKLISSNDDSEDKGAGLTTHHADSRLAAKLLSEGAYFVHVADAQHHGGPDFAYRLRVSAPQPDFELRVVPSSISGRAGKTVPITIYVLRKDGFTGEIDLALNRAPSGMTLSGGKILVRKDEAKLTVTLPEPQEEPFMLEIEGHASIDSCHVVRTAVPADNMQQAFAYHHLVPAKALKVAVAGQLATRGQVKIVNATPIKIPAGGTARVQAAAEIGEKASQLQFALSDSPSGITMKTVDVSPAVVEIEFTADGAQPTAGEKGNLVVQAFAVRTGVNGRQRRVSYGALPAIPFEITGEKGITETAAKRLSISAP